MDMGHKIHFFKIVIISLLIFILITFSIYTTKKKKDCIEIKCAECKAGNVDRSGFGPI